MVATTLRKLRNFYATFFVIEIEIDSQSNQNTATVNLVNINQLWNLNIV